MMVRTHRATLLDALTDGYEKFRRRLGRTLGSRDLASEALHETWLDLYRGGELDEVRNADAYVFIAALRKGRRLRKAEARSLSAVEIDGLLALADEAPSPERVAMGRSEIANLQRSLDALTRRQRIIFTGCYLGEATHAEMAERFGVSVRTVQNELREALLKVARRMIDKDRFGRLGPNASSKAGGADR